MKEPDLANWNEYDPEAVPDERRRMLLRTVDEEGRSMYYVVVILSRESGYCLTDLGAGFWRRWSEPGRKGTHYAWLDELKVMKD